MFVDELEYIEAGKERYPIAFNLNVNAKLQKEFESLKNWSEKLFPENKEDEKEEIEADLNAVITTAFFMINEGIDIENETRNGQKQQLSREQVGRIMTKCGIHTVTSILTKSNEKNDIEDEGEDTP